MLGLVVTGHGHFATGLNTGLELIAGVQPDVVLVDFETDHSAEMLKENLTKALESLMHCNGVLILADLAGGSPFKAAVELKYEYPDLLIEVVSGANLPLLIACATMTAVFDTPLELAEVMIPEGKNGMIRFEMPITER